MFSALGARRKKLWVPCHLRSRRWQEKVTVPGLLCSRRWQEKVTEPGNLRSRRWQQNVFRPRLITVNPTRERGFRSRCRSILSNGNERCYSRLPCVCVYLLSRNQKVSEQVVHCTSLPNKREGKVHVQDIYMSSQS